MRNRLRNSGWILAAAGVAGVSWFAVDYFIRPETVVSFPYPPTGPVAGDPIQLTYTGYDLLGEPPPDELLISSPGAEYRVPLAEGTAMEVEGRALTVMATRRWSGLMHSEHGQPMASVSIRELDGPWTEDLFLIPDRWQRLEPGVALGLLWSDSETAARGAVPDGLGLEQARWGVRDTGRVHWFNVFSPGVGVERDDGVVVTLVEVVDEEGEPPALTVLLRRGDSGVQRRIAAEDFGEDLPVVFEYPGLRPHVFLLSGWRSGAVHGAYYRLGELTADVVLASGESWIPDGSPFEVRLEQALDLAVPVARDESPFFEAVIASAEERHRIRQGEAVRVGNSMLRYLRLAEQVPARYTAEVELPGRGAETVSIGPGGRWTARRDGARMVIRQLEEGEDLAAFPERGLQVEAYRTRNGLLAAGGLLLASGLVVVMAGRRRGAEH